MAFRDLVKRWLQEWVPELFESRKFSPAEAMEQMLQALDRKKDVAAVAAGTADSIRKELEDVARQASDLKAQAAELLQSGDEPKARRLLERKLEADQRVATLVARYQEAQADAEAHVAEFLGEKATVEKRRRELPQIEADARYTRAIEQVARLERRATLPEAIGQFDSSVREIGQRRAEARNRLALGADPNAALDREIENDLGARRIDGELDKLRKEMEGIIEVQATEVTEDPVAAAQRVLAAPRYAGIIPAHVRETQPARRRND